jgi:hypothetical protein
MSEPSVRKTAARRVMSPLDVICPSCWAKPGNPCSTLKAGSVHKTRRQHAEAKAYELSLTGRSVCTCTNHLGRPKVQHKSKQAALTWMLKHRQVRGMRLEPYRCPTSNRWHVRTARKRVEAQKVGAVAPPLGP